MANKFPEHKNFNLSDINKEILEHWKENDTFAKSLSTREGKPEFVFYEGPPSANGMPGIHHVLSRTLKDAFCRYKTLQGFKVERKAGWDTHGLPVELAVEKKLGITKQDIGTKITVEEYNKTCREEVMKYTDIWEDVTSKIGYWVDMNDPYVTYENKYIESVWYLLKKFYQKGLLYKGYTIQPFSPAAGTGLSSHELNQPGAYQDVKDVTGIAQFKAIRDSKSEFLYKDTEDEVFFLAWTTTPWTLLSNTALAVGKKITYVKVKTFNPFTGKAVNIVMAESLAPTLFPEKNAELKFEDYNKGDKAIPFEITATFTGAELEGINYEQLLPYAQPEDGEAFKVISGSFVTTSDGTGIVHIAPSFGADDAMVAKQNGVGSLTLVDRQGKFTPETGEFAGRYVKNAFDDTLTEKDKSVDVDIIVKLKQENKLFKSAKYEHSYPHCWRTDKPILYYPLDSWFIRSTEMKDKMMELNKTINWKPKSTGEGRFGKWLENLIDWNLSRSRYWGTPLPIWRTDDSEEEICIGSMEEFKAEIEKAVEAGFMESNPLADFVVGDFSKENYDKFDLHRPFVDDIFLVSSKGKKMTRETDLIDVWFDSGAMPYAQLHYPFENKELFEKKFPADFIAEGVDQTRGWFFTLHAIGSMVFDSVAFKNIISTGLLQDKLGRKMSKRLGNGVEPFEAIEKYGSDPIRWYMLTNAQPWDNLKFDLDGVDEVRRKFFGTLYNTYSFFSLYANLDGFSYPKKPILVADRPEIDRWVISQLNSLVKNVKESFDKYEPTQVGRMIQNFVGDNLSNWYVRLNRKRFWGKEDQESKNSAYQTLYECLETISILMSPIAPFYADKLFMALNETTKRHSAESVHLADFPSVDESVIDKALETRMEAAQQISSMVLGLRRKCKIKVRQPLSKIMVPVLNSQTQDDISAVKNIILTEINVKDIEFLKDASGIFKKTIKPNFKILGKKYGKQMKEISKAFAKLNVDDIQKYEANKQFDLVLESGTLTLSLEEAEISTEDLPGIVGASNANFTVALDTSISKELKDEGIAREIVNRVQNLRKDSGLEISDKVKLNIEKSDYITDAITVHGNYIAAQVLANSVNISDSVSGNITEIEFEAGLVVKISVEKD